MTRVWGEGYMPHLDQTSAGFVLSMPVESGFVTLNVTFPVSPAAAQIVQADPVRIWLLYAGVHVLAHVAQAQNRWTAFVAGLPDLAETIMVWPLQTAIAQLRVIDAAHPRKGLRYMVRLLSQGAVTVDDAWQVSTSALGTG